MSLNEFKAGILPLLKLLTTYLILTFQALYFSFTINTATKIVNFDKIPPQKSFRYVKEKEIQFIFWDASKSFMSFSISKKEWIDQNSFKNSKEKK